MSAIRISNLTEELEDIDRKISLWNMRKVSLEKGEGFYEVYLSFGPDGRTVKLTSLTKKSFPVFGRRVHSDTHIEYVETGSYKQKKMVEMKEGTEVLCKELAKVCDAALSELAEERARIRTELKREVSKI